MKSSGLETQRTQYLLTTEYTLQIIILRPLKFAASSQIKGYWVFWESTASGLEDEEFKRFGVWSFWGLGFGIFLGLGLRGLGLQPAL